MRLLLLEDDATLGEGLRDYLRGDGHVVDWACRLLDTEQWAAEPFDLLLVDWQLPDGSGLHWLQRRRSRGDATPAIVLTARDRVVDRIHGLDSGADDYLVKPFAPEELVARMRAIARRAAGSARARLRVGPAEIDLDARAAYAAGRRVELTAREWALLSALALRPGRIVGKTELERLLLGGEADVWSNSVEVHVSSLRRKLGRGVVETVRGLGYRGGGA